MPNFCAFFIQKLMKFSWYLTIFPGHFSNIYLQSFRLLQNLTLNYKVLWKLMIFHETNEIFWYNTLLSFSFDVLCWLSLSLLVLLKVDHKIFISFGLIQNLDILDLAMVKVKKGNIADTYWQTKKNKNWCFLVYSNSWQSKAIGCSSILVGNSVVILEW